MMDSSEDFSELIRRCADKAYNFALRLAGNEHDARDLVQEAFARAFEHRERFESGRPFEAWLYRILRNVHLDHVRRFDHSRTVSLDAPSPVEDVPWEEMLPGSDSEPIEGLAREESENLVRKALSMLPEHYRSAVVLCDIEGVPYEKIGEIMNCPVGTVRSRIHQGRALMRKAFEELARGKGDIPYERP